MAGLQEVPTDLWPDWSDPRVDAIIALAPGAQFYGAEGLATLHVPTLLVEGGLDWYASGAAANYAPYSLMPTNLKTHLLFKEADHGIYLNSCATMPGLLAQGFNFCAGSVWDVDRRQDRGYVQPLIAGRQCPTIDRTSIVKWYNTPAVSQGRGSATLLFTWLGNGSTTWGVLDCPLYCILTNS